jgi:ribonuclease P protein component
MDASSTPHPDDFRPEHLPLHDRRLNKPYMYKKVFADGRALRSAPLTLRYLRGAAGPSRVGFILRKKVGDAPMRNSIRRTLRQCFVEALPGIREGAWIVFDVPERASQFRRGELRAQAQAFLAAVGQGRD